MKNNMTYKHILSFGGGVQTQALLVLLKNGFSNNPNAYVVFADTGNEHKETYDFINKYTLPYCKKHNINFVRVYNKYGKTLYEYCYDKKIVPSIWYRDCTSKFKISPIRKFIRNKLKVNRFNNKAFIYIGISFDEAWRLRESSVKYAINLFPLMDNKITREDCKEICVNTFGVMPPKSGCVFCPFAKLPDLLNPEYVDDTIKLEENNSRFPEIKLRGSSKKVKTVRELLVLQKTNKDKFLEEQSCKSGYCMV